MDFGQTACSCLHEYDVLPQMLLASLIVQNLYTQLNKIQCIEILLSYTQETLIIQNKKSILYVVLTNILQLIKMLMD